MKTIKEYQVTILITFIIVSILYGIHMFRYEYIDNSYLYSSTWSNQKSNTSILRVDRITNDVCWFVYEEYQAPAIYRYKGERVKLCDVKD